MMVKEAIDPSRSVASNPVTRVVLFGAILKLALVATGGWLGVGVGVGIGIGVGVGIGNEVAAKVAVAGLLAPLLSVAL